MIRICIIIGLLSLSSILGLWGEWYCKRRGIK